MEIWILIVFFFECVLDVYQWVEIEADLEIKECLYQGTAENSIKAACCCRGPVAKHYLMSKQNENPGWKKPITSFFSWYMQTFLLFCWQWLEKYFIIKAALHGHFLMIIDLFFSFCLWKYLNTSPVVEKLDGRKNLTYSSYLFSVGYKIRRTNWNQRALLDGYEFCHVTVLFLEGENLALKCGFPLAGTRRIAAQRIAAQKIAPDELPNPNPNPTPPPPTPRSYFNGGLLPGAVCWG